VKASFWDEIDAILVINLAHRKDRRDRRGGQNTGSTSG
jgi:hypothetical protein